jgi:hypothetical protein
LRLPRLPTTQQVQGIKGVGLKVDNHQLSTLVEMLSGLLGLVAGKNTIRLGIKRPNNCVTFI